MALLGLFDRIGAGFANLLSDPGTGLYAIYVIVIFMGLFTLYQRLLNMTPHLKGKPASVISLMISVISTGGLLFNKTADQVIAMFQGFFGFIGSIILAIVIIGSCVAWSKKFEKTHIKTLIISWAVYAASAFLVPVYVNFFNIVSSTTNPGPAQVIGDLLQTISDVALFVGFVSLFIFVFNLFKFGTEEFSFGRGKKNPRKEEIKEARKILDDLLNDFKTSNDAFENKVKILNKYKNELSNGGDTKNV